ncbi:hypothetical protein OJF2_69550 [Aquisphaera giovannonii]|uniref:3-keto-alpha-glucoside-1,2-lyase/3-keto-2-hydroxy-glucal hydratase domain-containing protein n=1 Tax=Aquisphaera giovannonii TaxID=406548 RepID=A0A5B9WDK8_9BACT|nr:DUF1080 domain-containing protein [Aquisphaera giovannonii]QEH38354.1 hypothetical protein OJF2_69550 [Aquisphaera giovannonii]
MRYVLAFACVFTSLCLRAPAQERPTPLFNGKDLSGWTAVFEAQGADPSRTWSVADGVLKCTGKPVGYLKTDREYSDYVLTVEWRWPAGTEGGNNGVLVHSTTPRALGIWPKSIEVQLFKGNAGEFWVIGTDLDVADEATRKQDRRHRNLVYGSEKPVGEWNRMEIACKGDTIRVKVNGTLVNEATNCSVSRGAICLQSEGSPIEFRNIVLTPLAK